MIQEPPRHGEGDRPRESGDGGGGPALLRQPFKQVRKARALRKAMRLPEVVLWRELRKRPGGYKFRKPVPLAPYTVDFACLSTRLVIEIDGEAHDRGDGRSETCGATRIWRNEGFELCVFQRARCCGMWRIA